MPARPPIPASILFILATLVVAACGPAFASEPRDRRVVVTPAASPWQAVGRLNVAGFRARRHCTATLVADDLALTARHCLAGFLGQEWVAPSQVHFLPGYAHGSYIDHRRAIGFELVGDEAVLVRLSGVASMAPIPVASQKTTPGMALFEAGYSGDRGQVLTVDPACRFLGWSQDGLWRHDCRAIGGDSGAPILVDTGDGLAVAAIHVGRRDGVGLAEPLDAPRLHRRGAR